MREFKSMTGLVLLMLSVELSHAQTGLPPVQLPQPKPITTAAQCAAAKAIGSNAQRAGFDVRSPAFSNITANSAFLHATSTCNKSTPVLTPELCRSAKILEREINTPFKGRVQTQILTQMKADVATILAGSGCK